LGAGPFPQQPGAILWTPRAIGTWAMDNIFGIIVLLLDIWAIINVIGSRVSILAKVLWTLGIIILPVIGFIIWYFAGPKSGDRLTT
jgi:uncharacterized integral membrane protein